MDADESRRLGKVLGLVFLVQAGACGVTYYLTGNLYGKQKRILEKTASGLELQRASNSEDSSLETLSYARANLIDVMEINSMDRTLPKMSLKKGDKYFKALRSDAYSLERGIMEGLPRPMYKGRFLELSEKFRLTSDAYTNIVAFSGIERDWAISGGLFSLVVSGVCLATTYKKKP